MPVLVGTIVYPFGKRSTAQKLGVYPQFILGATLAWPAIAGWSSIYGLEQSCTEIFFYCLPQFLFFFFWTLYFNTAYSYQDIQDDRTMNVNSLYVLAGEHIHGFLVILGTLTLASLPWILYPVTSPWLWVSWMGVWLASFLEQLLRFDAHEPATGGFVHKRNFALGIWNIVACAIEVLLRA